jgi:hypothetical protein
MPGTLVITTLSDGTNSTSATNPIRGSAKAWVNWDGTSGAGNTIRSSYNVSSITRLGTGRYTVNFTTAFADTNYAVTATTQFNTSGNEADHNLMGAEISNISDAMQTGLVKVSGKYGAATTTYDMSIFCVAVFR